MLLIKNGKAPDEPYNARLSFWLPPDTPYGNLQLKYMKIIWRLDEANRKIIDSWKFWQECIAGETLGTGTFERHIFSIEETIYMLRRAGDELVSMICMLENYEAQNQYPNKIKIDCFGALLAQGKNERIQVFSGHEELMEKLNDIANAFKHSFINSDHTLVGFEEPRIHALNLSFNKLSSDPVFYDVKLDDIVSEYSDFYNDCVEWLSKYSERNRY
jgi:hypothetical protein